MLWMIYKSRGYIEGVTWENIWKHKSGLVTGVDVNYHAPQNFIVFTIYNLKFELNSISNRMY